MKKILTFTLFIVLILSLGGCTEEIKDEAVNSNDIIAEDEVVESDDKEEINDKSEKNDEEIESALDYYPFVKNKMMEYKGEGSEYAEMNTFVEFIDDNLIQIKTMNAGTDIVKVLEYKDGVLREVFSEAEFYHIENMLDASRNKDNIILKEPIEIGNSWKDEEGNKVEITGLDKDIDIDLGKYKALEVTTEYGNNEVKRDYYVKEIGYVGNIYEDEEFQVKTFLKNISEQEMELPIKVYYPLAEEVGSKYINKNIVFKTNDDTRLILEKLFKNPNTDKLLALMPEDISINKINLNRDNWNLEVDLSEAFIEEMNAGSSYEIEVINSIVNTLGSFYDVERVYLTVGGKAYESGHLQLLEDEYFEVDTKDIEELK